MTRPIGRFGVATLAALTALALALPGTAIAGVGDNLSERVDTTWRVVPEDGVYRSTSKVVLGNTHKPTKKKRWYFDAWGPLYIPDIVEDFTATGKGVTTEHLESTVSDWELFTLHFPQLHYKKKQKLTFSFDLPEVEGRPYRIEDAYLHFCWLSVPTDTGTVKAVLPSKWEPITYRAFWLPKAKRTADSVILSAPAQDGERRFNACTEAFAPDLLETVALPAEDGSGVITLAAWPDDAAWLDFVRSEVETARPWLEEQLGMDFPLSELMFREVGREGRANGMSDRHPEKGIIGIIEDDFVPGTVATRLARTWFGASEIADPWLAEGLSFWIGHTAIGEPCYRLLRQVDVLTGEEVIVDMLDEETASPDLSQWTEPVNGTSIQSSYDATRYRSARTCAIVADAAEAIGADAMADIIAGLLASDEPATVADWLVEVALASDAETIDAVRGAITEAGLTS
jgi:hypothetical protein